MKYLPPVFWGLGFCSKMLRTKGREMILEGRKIAAFELGFTAPKIENLFRVFSDDLFRDFLLFFGVQVGRGEYFKICKKPNFFASFGDLDIAARFGMIRE